MSAVGGREMAEALVPDILKLLANGSSRPLVKKRAALCLLRLLHKTPLGQEVGSCAFAVLCGSSMSTPASRLPPHYHHLTHPVIFHPVHVAGRPTGHVLLHSQRATRGARPRAAAVHGYTATWHPRPQRAGCVRSRVGGA